MNTGIAVSTSDANEDVSSVIPARAHRFYFREGMHIPSYHFALALQGDEPGRNGTGR